MWKRAGQRLVIDKRCVIKLTAASCVVKVLRMRQSSPGPSKVFTMYCQVLG